MKLAPQSLFEVPFSGNVALGPQKRRCIEVWNVK